MYEFDKKLHALAGCPVIEGENGAVVFDPNPVIVAENDPILSHEVCHILAGRSDYEIFATAVEVRRCNLEGEVFKHILNMLYDWYHEYLYGKYSGFLWGRLSKLHEAFEHKATGLKDIDKIDEMYCKRDISPGSVGIRDSIDLVAWADKICENTLKQAKKLSIGLADLVKILGLKREFRLNNKGKGDPNGKHRRKLGGPKSDIGVPKKSSYYVTAVSKYFHIINELATLWKKNKYGWLNNYYGEIDWKDLPGMFQGEKLSLPVWRLFQKIGVARKIYLVIDRSSSTQMIKEVIMDTAIIIAESLRMLGIPISILDVGVTCDVVNGIDEPLDLTWFTPMAHNGTPLGEVCPKITKADHNSYLLIITDGEPDDWDTLLSALNAFPGADLTFVIGDSYGEYAKKVKNAIHVEPHTIIREMLHDSTLG